MTEEQFGFVYGKHGEQRRQLDKGYEQDSSTYPVRTTCTIVRVASHVFSCDQNMRNDFASSSPILDSLPTNTAFLFLFFSS